MGNLFYRGQQISEIYKLSYFELEYWNGWHEKMCEAEREAMKKAEGK
jgi:hypothetical protein